jgi:transposase-like protein
LPYHAKKGSVAKTGKAPGSVELHADDPGHPTIDFLLTARRDAAAARRFFRKAVSSPGNPAPRVINVDKNPAFPHAVEALKMEGILPQRVEQDHRTVKKGTWPAKGYGSLRLHGGRGKALRQWR